MKKDNLFVITGGPGMGKTTVITALQESGYTCVPESGRDIIQQQVASGGEALPWRNREAFAARMFEQALRDFQAQSGQMPPVFFDRGIADTIGYLTLCGLPVPALMSEAARQYRFNNRVFFTPPWPAIYEQDNERKQSFEEAVRTYEQLLRTYEELGYEVVILPKVSVAERVQFILSVIDDACQI
ncbi:MAG: AAA family ATPase [Chitinophaga sp.]|uniref:AAA family ATPase n=1 Tax=Chitinophaga sp. TaxID=1869181 RepID=UPI001B10CDC0|nr:AAA family ATPase [Chitinophaga sp.]MBO9731555.1 AAA family ATPase [Chitinophaga sp.]